MNHKTGQQLWEEEQGGYFNKLLLGWDALCAEEQLEWAKHAIELAKKEEVQFQLKNILQNDIKE